MNNFFKIVVMFLINVIGTVLMIGIFTLVLNFCFTEMGKTIDSSHHEEVEVIQKATSKFCNTKFNDLKKYTEEQ